MNIDIKQLPLSTIETIFNVVNAPGKQIIHDRFINLDNLEVFGRTNSASVMEYRQSSRNGVPYTKLNLLVSELLDGKFIYFHPNYKPVKQNGKSSRAPGIRYIRPVNINALYNLEVSYSGELSLDTLQLELITPSVK